MLHVPNEKCTLIEEVELAAVEAKGDGKVELDEAVDTVISSYHISTCADSARPDAQLLEEQIKFKYDPIWEQVADVSCVLDPEVLCNILDEQLSLLQLSAEVESIVANPQVSDCVIFYASEDFTDVFASATHAENPKGVSVDLLSKIWRIDYETTKGTIKTTTQLNKQDANSKLSQNFCTNDWILLYKWIKYFSSQILYL